MLNAAFRYKSRIEVDIQQYADSFPPKKRRGEVVPGSTMCTNIKKHVYKNSRQVEARAKNEIPFEGQLKEPKLTLGTVLYCFWSDSHRVVASGICQAVAHLREVHSVRRGCHKTVRKIPALIRISISLLTERVKEKMKERDKGEEDDRGVRTATDKALLMRFGWFAGPVMCELDAL